MEKKECVELVVKASNQQFDDQIIKCETTWSVLKLKEHLAEVYPCQPTIAEQKLIYHGQLLKDNSILKNILRTYDDMEPSNHIFHLVYTSKQRPYTEKTVGNDKKSTAETANQKINSTSSPVTPNAAVISGNNSAMNIPQLNTIGYGDNAMSTENFNNLFAHQITVQNWQQVYAQYMNQYMRLLSAGIRPETFFIQNTPACSSSMQRPGDLSQTPIFQRNSPFENLLQENMFERNLNNGNGPVIGQQQPGNVNPQAPQEVNPALQNPQQPQQAPARFPEIVQEEQENRDWLDTFYSFSRLMVLLTLVYLYSSPLRCLAVLFIAVAIYMYHVGYFRNHVDGVEANNNNDNNNINNNAAAVGGPADLQNPADNQERVDDGNAGNSVNNATNDPNNSSNLVPELENRRASVIGFVRTFIITLFTSLLPETPAL